MQNINELIKKLCPNGVKFISLGDVYDFQYGTGNKIPTEGGEYPVYGSNGIVGTHTKYNSEDSPVIGHIGAYAGIVNWGKGKHFVTYNGVICKFKRTEDMLPKFAYQLLLQQNFREMAKDGSQPFVSYEVLRAPLVPIPPIEIQGKVVEILERLDELERELESKLNSELELRKKQYAYYRNKLLSFEEYVNE